MMSGGQQQMMCFPSGLTALSALTWAGIGLQPAEERSWLFLSSSPAGVRELRLSLHPELALQMKSELSQNDYKPYRPQENTAVRYLSYSGRAFPSAWIAHVWLIKAACKPSLLSSKYLCFPAFHPSLASCAVTFHLG